MVVIFKRCLENETLISISSLEPWYADSQYESAVRVPDLVLGKEIELTRLPNEPTLPLRPYNDPTFVEEASRYFTRAEIDDDELYSPIAFLAYLRNNPLLREEYEE
ncbi:hypothetical protein MMC24_006957 [Lignoscripta atroalba]|nr:hypothetical protein [Lignoscripta atroalba]